ncbi:MAG: hypothetical protein LUC43_07750 [Burkholderiales bacterium]|nr:hypothetical protein [Burkholderiales bacterium]
MKSIKSKSNGNWNQAWIMSDLLSEVWVDVLEVDEKEKDSYGIIPPSLFSGDYFEPEEITNSQVLELAASSCGKISAWLGTLHRNFRHAQKDLDTAARKLRKVAPLCDKGHDPKEIERWKAKVREKYGFDALERKYRNKYSWPGAKLLKKVLARIKKADRCRAFLVKE